jgi:hypothetical protein
VRKPRKPGNGRILYVAVMALLLPAASLAANSVTVRVQVTFVDPVGISEVSALQFGSGSQYLADQERVTVASIGTMSDPADYAMGGAKIVVRGAPQAAAKLTVKAVPRQSITILVDGASPGAGYSLTDFRCSYNGGSDTACDGAGYTETSVASGTLFVGATLTGDGTAVAGAADGTFEVTITYQ